MSCPEWSRLLAGFVIFGGESKDPAVDTYRVVKTFFGLPSLSGWTVALPHSIRIESGPQAESSTSEFQPTCFGGLGEVCQ